MKAKEKAIEIYEDLRSTAPLLEANVRTKIRAKYLVDEITNLLADINNKESYNVSKYANYWHEVKQEIDNI